MKKSVTVIMLLCSIATSCIYCFLYIHFNVLGLDNPVNIRFRPYAINNRLATTIFRLHQMGDARNEYMKQYALPLDIHIFLQNGETLENETIEKAVQQLKLITYKTQKAIIHDPILLDIAKARVNDADINTILDSYEFRSSILSHTVPLNIFVLSEYEQEPSYAGLVVDANSIILFKKIIREVSDNQPSPQDAEVSTILHEFAHLLGAEHINNSSCILAEKVENIDLFNRPTVFRDSYCAEDISAIINALE